MNNPVCWKCKQLCIREGSFGVSEGPFLSGKPTKEYRLICWSCSVKEQNHWFFGICGIWTRLKDFPDWFLWYYILGRKYSRSCS